jgi:predicted MFS family arabinose efflux permease
MVNVVGDEGLVSVAALPGGRTGFAWLAGATAALYLGVGITIPTIPRFAERSFGASGADLGLLAVAYTVGALACRPGVAVMAQRIRQSATALIGLLIVVTAIAAHIGARSLVLLALVRSMFAVGETLAFLGITNLVTTHAAEGRQSEAASHNSAALFAGIGVGPVIGDRLSRTGSFTAAFLIAALCAIIALFCVRLARRHVVDPALTPLHPVDASVPRMRRLGLHRGGVRPGLVLSCIVIAQGTWSLFLTPYADSIGVAEVGALFFVSSAVILVLRIVAAKVPDRVGLRRSAAFSVVGVGSGLVMLGLVQGRVGLWLSVAFVSLGMAQMFPALMGITLGRVSVADRPLAVSTFVMFFEVGSALGGASGWLVDHHGYPPTFVVAGLVCLLGLGFLGSQRSASTA